MGGWKCGRQSYRVAERCFAASLLLQTGQCFTQHEVGGCIRLVCVDAASARARDSS